jgi:hypothetical protein
MALPLVDRKIRLEAFLIGAPESLRYNDHQIGQGPAFHRLACQHELEGIVSKRVDGRYEPDRRSWLKTKCLNREEFVVVGWSDPEGSRHRIGALLLGYYPRTASSSMPAVPAPGCLWLSLSACGSVFGRSLSIRCLYRSRRLAAAVLVRRSCSAEFIGFGSRWLSRSATPSGRLTVCSDMSFTWVSGRTSPPSTFDATRPNLKS